MIKRCGCSYIEGCLCSSPPKKSFEEKIYSSLVEIKNITEQEIKEVSLAFENKQYKLNEKIKDLNEIISASKITDVRALKQELKTQKELTASWKISYEGERKLRNLLLDNHPRLKKAFQELDDKEFVTYTKQYFKELKKDK